MLLMPLPYVHRSCPYVHHLLMPRPYVHRLFGADATRSTILYLPVFLKGGLGMRLRF